MNRWIGVMGLFFALLLPAAAEEKWVKLETDSLPPAWRQLEEEIGGRRWVMAEFTEKRFFPFRSRPVELAGVVWYGQEEGLTLRYTAPRDEVVRVSEAGVRTLQGRGRGRTVPERGRDIPAALLSLFRLDFEELERRFEMEGQRTEEEWRLRLQPRDPDQAPIQRIELHGRDGEVQRISIEQTERRRIELHLTDPVYPDDLDDETRARVFP